jgi:anti-sigma-K factor RskA
MMKDARHEEVKELIPAYVLGAVPDEEMALIRAHILSCDECLAEADSFAETTSSLSLAVEPVELPSGFADRVVAAATGSELAPAQQPVTSSQPAKRRFGLRWSLVPTAAFVALIIAVSAVSVSLYQTKQTADRQREALAAIIEGHRGIDLRGPAGAVATLVPTDSGSLFVASGLGEVPDEKTYQLWLMKGDVPTSAGTFEVSEGLVMFETSKSINGYTGAAVTIEPAGGSPGPTGVQVVKSFS